MTRVLLTFMTMLMLLGGGHCAQAWTLWGDSKPLLTLNGQEYQVEDYLNWWHEWREGDQLPESSDDYVDWLLLADEAEQMQLQDKPSYQKKVATFLKVRSLMLLKKEEIDDKLITPDEEMLRTFYRENFTPRWQLRTISFRNEADLQQFIDAYEASPDKSSEDLLKTLSVAEKDYSLSSTIWQRPNRLPGKILELLKNVQDQRFSAPYSWGKTWQVIEVLTTEQGSDDDFNQLRNTLKQQYRKQQQNRLNAALMERLEEKYQVETDDNLIREIKYAGPPEGRGDDIVLEMLSHQLTAAELHNAAKQQYDTFSPQQRLKVPFAQTLQRVLGAIISQNLVDAEALDRHYEERPPLKGTFDFYRKHRLIKELEKQLVAPEVKVSEDEVKQLYAQRKEQLTGPVVVEIVRGETVDADLAERLEKKLRQGEDISRIMAVLGNSTAKSDQLPLQHLSSALQQLLKTLQPGQAGMVKEGDRFIFVQLVKPPEQRTVPFVEVKNALEAELKGKAFQQRRREIVQQLRSRSTISIDQQQWQRCLDILKEES